MRRLRRWYIPACRGQRGPAGRRRPADRRPPGPACGPHCNSSICFTGTVLTTCLPRVCFIATAVRRSHSSCYYYYYYYYGTAVYRGLIQVVPECWPLERALLSLFVVDENIRHHRSSAAHLPAAAATDWSAGYRSRDIALVRGPTLSFRNVSRFCEDDYECRADNGATSGPVSHRVRLTVECTLLLSVILLTNLLTYTCS